MERSNIKRIIAGAQLAKRERLYEAAFLLYFTAVETINKRACYKALYIRGANAAEIKEYISDLSSDKIIQLFEVSFGKTMQEYTNGYFMLRLQIETSILRNALIHSGIVINRKALKTLCEILDFYVLDLKYFWKNETILVSSKAVPVGDPFETLTGKLRAKKEPRSIKSIEEEAIKRGIIYESLSTQFSVKTANKSKLIKYEDPDVIEKFIKASISFFKDQGIQNQSPSIAGFNQKKLTQKEIQNRNNAFRASR